MRVTSSAVGDRGLRPPSKRLQGVVMMVLTTVSQVLAILRVSVVSSTFGASTEYDAFAISYTVSSAAVSLLSGAFGSVLIPALVQGRDRRGTDTFLTVMSSLAACLALVTWIASGLVAGRAEVWHFSPFLTHLVVLLPLITTTQALSLVTGTASIRLQARDHFALPQLIQVLGLAAIVARAALDEHLTIHGYATMILVTTVATTTASLLLARRRGAPARISFAVRDPEFLSLLRTYVPTALSTGVYQLSLVIDSTIAAHLGTGNATLLSWSTTVASTFAAVLLTPVATMSLPTISAAAGRSPEAGRRAALRMAAMRATLAAVPASAFLVAGWQAVALVYLRGAVTVHDVDVVTECVTILVLTLPINAARDVCYQLLLAHRDTRTPFVNSLSASAVNIVSSVLLSIPFGIHGVVAGTTITSVASLCFILPRIHRRWPFTRATAKAGAVEAAKLVVVCATAALLTAGLGALMPGLPLAADFVLRTLLHCSFAFAGLVLLDSRGLHLLLPSSLSTRLHRFAIPAARTH